MKNIIVCLSLLVALLAAPLPASAQALPSEFNLFAAWVTNFGMTEYALDAVESPTGHPLGSALGIITFDYDYDAIQLGASAPVTMGDMGLLTLSGALALPSTGTGREQFTRHSPGTRPQAGRDWDADTFFAYLEGLCSYPVYGGFTALGGFRWCNWQTSYKNSRNFVQPTRYDDRDTGDVTVNTYVPFVGVMIDMGGLSTGAIGFPAVFGAIESTWVDEPGDLFRFSGEFGGGYFLEAFIGYDVSMTNAVGDSELSIGLLVKYSTLRAETTLNLERIVGSFPRTPAPYDLAFKRNLFTLGAKATLDFNIAGLLPF